MRQTESLARFAKHHLPTTRRSGGVPRDGAPVLVDMPNAHLLEMAHRGADGWSLCAIEGGHLSLAGWAAATNAINLVTGRRPDPLSRTVLNALAHLHRVGNNGWHDQPGKRDAKEILRELVAAMPSIDADFVIGYMIAMGAFGRQCRCSAEDHAEISSHRECADTRPLNEVNVTTGPGLGLCFPVGSCSVSRLPPWTIALIETCARALRCVTLGAW